MTQLEKNNYILSTNVRFFRNVEDVEFVDKFSADDAENLNFTVRQMEAVTLGEYEFFNVNSYPQNEITYWSDRYHMPFGQKNTEYERLAITSRDGLINIVTNEVEHITVQSFENSYNIKGCYERASEILNVFGRRIPYAHRSEIGYLTANPWFSGNAMKMGVLVHIPAIAVSPDFIKLIEKLGKDGVGLLGYYSEAGKTFGAFYQLTNIYTRGISEYDTVKTIEAAVDEIVETEMKQQEELIGANRQYVYDVAWRSLGILACARRVGMADFMANISNLRLGAELGVFDIGLEEIDEIMNNCQIGYIKRYMQRNSIDENENTDNVRARILREEFSPKLKELL